MSLIATIYSRKNHYFNWQNPPKYNKLWEEGLTPQPPPDLTLEKKKGSTRQYKSQSKVLKQVRVKRQNRIYFRKQLTNVLEKRTQKISGMADRLKQTVKNLPKANQLQSISPSRAQIILSPRPTTGGKAENMNAHRRMSNLSPSSKVGLGLATAGLIYLAARNNLPDRK